MTQLEKPETKTRKTYLDAVKLLAIYMVVFNHTGTNGFALFLEIRGSALYYPAMFNAILVKIAVPLFFMVSGALLLGREEPIRTLLQKRFLKYLAALAAGSAIAYLYLCLRQEPQALSLSYFLTKLYSSQLATAYWYFYVYLAYLLMLPLLRRLAGAMREREYRWMFLLYAGMQLLTIVDFLLWRGQIVHNPLFSLPVTLDYMFYPFMGYYIDRRLNADALNGKRLALMAAAGAAGIAVCCALTESWCTLINEWEESSCQTFFMTLTFLPAIAVFCALKLWFTAHRPGEKWQALLSAAGGTIFGIFLFEQIAREETKSVLFRLEPSIGLLPACWAWVLAACLAAGVLVWLAQKIPGIRALL